MPLLPANWTFDPPPVRPKALPPRPPRRPLRARLEKLSRRPPALLATLPRRPRYLQRRHRPHGLLPLAPVAPPGRSAFYFREFSVEVKKWSVEPNLDRLREGSSMRSGIFSRSEE